MGNFFSALRKESVDLTLRGRSRHRQTNTSVGADAQIQPLDATDMKLVRIVYTSVSKRFLFDLLFHGHFLASTFRNRQSNSYSAVLLESQ